MIRAARLRKSVNITSSRPPQVRQRKRACSSAAGSGSTPSNGTTRARDPAAGAADKRAEKPTTAAAAPALDASRAVAPKRSEWRPSEAHRASATSVARKVCIELHFLNDRFWQRSLNFRRGLCDKRSFFLDHAAIWRRRLRTSLSEVDDSFELAPRVSGRCKSEVRRSARWRMSEPVAPRRACVVVCVHAVLIKSHDCRRYQQGFPNVDNLTNCTPRLFGRRFFM